MKDRNAFSLVLRITLVVLFLLSSVTVVYAEASNQIDDKETQEELPPTYVSACEEMIATQAAGTIYETEVNDSRDAADVTFNDYDNYGKISSANDVDWWAVSFNFSGYANFWLGSIPADCDYDMKLYASDGSLLTSSTKPGNTSELIEKYWVTEGSYYFIRIHSYSGYSTSSYYKFRAKNYAYSQYAGFTNSGANKGISATITTPSALPNVADSGESAWVSTSTDSNGAWIQTGIRYYAMHSSSFRSYTESYQNGGYTLSQVGTQSLSTSVTYKVEFSSADRKWHAYISGVDKVSSTLATTNMGVQCNAEMHKKLIQLGPFTFSNVQTKSASGIWASNTIYPTVPESYSVSGSASNFTVSGP